MVQIPTIQIHITNSNAVLQIPTIQVHKTTSNAVYKISNEVVRIPTTQVHITTSNVVQIRTTQVHKTTSNTVLKIDNEVVRIPTTQVHITTSNAVHKINNAVLLIPIIQVHITTSNAVLKINNEVVRIPTTQVHITTSNAVHKINNEVVRIPTIQVHITTRKAVHKINNAVLLIPIIQVHITTSNAVLKINNEVVRIPTTQVHITTSNAVHKINNEVVRIPTIQVHITTRKAVHKINNAVLLIPIIQVHITTSNAVVRIPTILVHITTSNAVHKLNNVPAAGAATAPRIHKTSVLSTVPQAIATTQPRKIVTRQVPLEPADRVPLVTSRKFPKGVCLVDSALQALSRQGLKHLTRILPTTEARQIHQQADLGLRTVIQPAELAAILLAPITAAGKAASRASSALKAHRTESRWVLPTIPGLAKVHPAQSSVPALRARADSAVLLTHKARVPMEPVTARAHQTVNKITSRGPVVIHPMVQAQLTHSSAAHKDHVNRGSSVPLKSRTSDLRHLIHTQDRAITSRDPVAIQAHLMHSSAAPKPHVNRGSGVPLKPQIADLRRPIHTQVPAITSKDPMAIPLVVQAHLTHNREAPKPHVNRGSGVPLKPQIADRRHPIHTRQVHPVTSKDPMAIPPVVQARLTHSSLARKDRVSEGSGVPLKHKTADRRHPLHTQVRAITSRDPMAIPQTVQAHLTHSSAVPKPHVNKGSSVPLKHKLADRRHPIHTRQDHPVTSKDPMAIPPVVQAHLMHNREAPKPLVNRGSGVPLKPQIADRRHPIHTQVRLIASRDPPVAIQAHLTHSSAAPKPHVNRGSGVPLKPQIADLRRPIHTQVPAITSKDPMAIPLVVQAHLTHNREAPKPLVNRGSGVPLKPQIADLRHPIHTRQVHPVTSKDPMAIPPVVQAHLTHSSLAHKDRVSEGSGVPLKHKTADRRHPIHTQVHPVANRDPMAIPQTVQAHQTHSSLAPKDHVWGDSGVPLKPKTADGRHPVHIQAHQTATRDPTDTQAHQTTNRDPTDTQTHQTATRDPTDTQTHQTTNRDPTDTQTHQTTNGDPTDTQTHQTATRDPTDTQAHQTTNRDPTDTQTHQTATRDPTDTQTHQTTNRDPTDTQTHPANNATNKGLVITRAHQTLSKATSNHKRPVDKDRTAPTVLRTPALEDPAITSPTHKTLVKAQALAIQTRSSAALKVPVAIRLTTPTLRVTRALTDLILLQATLAVKRGTLAASLGAILEPVCTLVVMATTSKVSTAFDFI